MIVRIFFACKSQFINGNNLDIDVGSSVMSEEQINDDIYIYLFFFLAVICYLTIKSLFRQP